jgi:hypothetical protein
VILHAEVSDGAYYLKGTPDEARQNWKWERFLPFPALTIQRIELLPPTVCPPTIIVYIIGNRTAISPFP